MLAVKENGNVHYLSEKIDTITKSIGAALAIQRTGKLYQTKIPKFASNPTSQCTKQLANADMVCMPSTDTTKGQDDYVDSGEMLFKWWHCNYTREPDGFAVPTAFESDGDYKTTGAVDVGTLCPTFYYSFQEQSDHYLLTVSDTPNDEYDLKPFEAAVREDGTVMPYFILSSYFSSDVNGILRSQPNRIVKNFMSYENTITEYAKKGSGYHGAGAERNTYQLIWQLIKYGTKNSQTVFKGVTDLIYQYPASKTDLTNVKYFPVTTAQAANISVGDLVYIGYPTNKSGTNVDLDRGVASMRAFSGGGMVKVTNKTEIDSGNVAIHVDVTTGFNTEDQLAIDGLDAHVYITSMGRMTGETDNVIGKYDGSYRSNTNGKNSYRIQGVEYACGYWFTASNTVLDNKTDFTRDVYKCNRWDTRLKNDTIKTTYTKVGTVPANSTGTNGYDDYWIGDVVIKEGVQVPVAIGSGDSTGVGDRVYMGGNSTELRQFLLGGLLWDGSNAGSSCLHCRVTLTWAIWSFAGAD